MCTSPYRAFKTGLKTESGKDLLYIDTHYPCPKVIPLPFAESRLKLHIPYSGDFVMFKDGMSFLYNSVPIPCGKCQECKMDHAREWSYRCLMEASTSPGDCHFLTLTYDDAHLPSELRKEDLSLFMKRLRNIVGTGVRFFGCGELGEKSNRPHFHLILFNCPLNLTVANQVNQLYFSSEVAQAWQYGMHIIGEVTSKSAAYVARYTNKKTDGHAGFINMSRMPGIGEKYLRDHVSAFLTDRLPLKIDDDVFCVTPPRYFEKLFPDLDFTENKARRIYNAERKNRLECFVHGLNPIHLDDYKRFIAKDKLSRLERNL